MSLVAHGFGRVEFWISIPFNFFNCTYLQKTIFDFDTSKSLSYQGHKRTIFWLELNGYLNQFLRPSKLYIQSTLNIYLICTVADTIDCVCSKLLNHWLMLSLFKFFGWKYSLNWINSEWKKTRLLVSDLRFLF